MTRHEDQNSPNLAPAGHLPGDPGDTGFQPDCVTNSKTNSKKVHIVSKTKLQPD